METITDEILNVVKEFKRLPDYDRFPLPDFFYKHKEFGFKKEDPNIDITPKNIPNGEYNRRVPAISNEIINEIKDVYLPKSHVSSESGNQTVLQLVS